MVLVLVLVAATAALIAFIPSLRRLSHASRAPEREAGLIPGHDDAVEPALHRGEALEPAVRRGGTDEWPRPHRGGQRQLLRRPAGDWRLSRRSEQDQLYDASEVERVVREQLYGSRSHRS